MSQKAGERFVFKQRFKSRNMSSTKVLNQKHLIYIATRPGVMKNPDCGFGLWGKLPGMSKIDNVMDLRAARVLVGEASEQHTLYRAVLSVDRETAQEYGLYERDAWEKLLRSRIDVLRRGMGIKKENFCWVAAMHYKKHHPHVHILYWDNGTQPRQEFISPERFEAVSEEVRKSFTAALVHGEEISQLQEEKDEREQETRLRLRALLKDANLADALDLDHVKASAADELGKELLELAFALPRTGRLNYAFVPQEYKARLDAFVGRVLKITDFRKLEWEYVQLAGDVSELYGNSEKIIERREDEARKQFRKVLANEVLSHLKEVKRELEAREPPADEAALVAAMRRGVQTLVREMPEYRELLAKLPTARTPAAELMKDADTAQRFNTLAAALTKDIRLRVKADALFHQKAESVTSKEEKAALGKDIERAFRAAVRRGLWDTVREDKGWAAEELRETAVICLLRLFRDASQSKGQLQARRELERERWRNLSETAKKDLRKQREQQGSWEPEI